MTARPEGSPATEKRQTPAAGGGGEGQEDVVAVPLRRLLAYARPHAPVLALAALLSCMAAVVELAQPLVVKQVFSQLSDSRPVTATVLLIVGLFLAEALLGSVQSYLLGRIGEGVVLDLRTSLVRRLLKWPMATYARHRSGDLISRVSADTTAVHGALASSLTETLAGVLTFAGSLVLMLMLDPLLLGLTLGCLLIASVSVFTVSVRVMKATVEAQRAVGRLGAGLERVLRAIRTVKLSNAEEREESALISESRDSYLAGIRQAKLQALIHPVTALSVQGSLVLVLGIGGARVANGTMELGELIAFLLYLMYLAVPATTLFSSFTDLQAGRAALARVQELLDEPLETEPPAGPAAAPDPEPAPPSPARRRPSGISLHGVTFAYPGRDDRPTLRDLGFEVPELSRTALVGPSGAGKSTVLSLIGRMYDADRGAVRLLGRDVTRMPLKEVRDLIGHVEQESPVMAGTLRSNLTYAHPDATDAEIAEVLARTNLTEFADSLPQGLETEVGDGGILVSGGQRQRIAIARMLLKRPRILLLDEVTSQMDAENERLLNETLKEAAASCTVLVVAHRLSTIQDADQILVMDAGRIIQTGTHDHLIREPGLYAHLARTQLLPTAPPQPDPSAAAR
ncbi:ABC transporter ATP-binding protein [Streptomyces sp. SBST2-5]|uniref:ABC transporter ATP-binding protein n=1 Tax=Streptomyces composti TaxID=2720025 RepID=A0ABX1AB74_9ACTN|nr:ABC transporter ATP-binding protein [Streptomyces composti]NJP52671.1 ABC transporter ATP-binding protein [Streptomyces composti]